MTEQTYRSRSRLIDVAISSYSNIKKEKEKSEKHQELQEDLENMWGLILVVMGVYKTVSPKLKEWLRGF